MKLSKSALAILCIFFLVLYLGALFFYLNANDKNEKLKEELDFANRQISLIKDTQDINFTDAKRLEKYKSIFYKYMEKEDLVLVCLDSDYTYFHDVHVLEYCEYITDFENDSFRVVPRENVTRMGYTMCPDCQNLFKSYLESHKQ